MPTNVKKDIFACHSSMVISLITNKVSKQIILQTKVWIIKFILKLWLSRKKWTHNYGIYDIKKSKWPTFKQALFTALPVTVIPPKFCRYCILYSGTILVKNYYFFWFLPIWIAYCHLEWVYMVLLAFRLLIYGNHRAIF